MSHNSRLKMLIKESLLLTQRAETETDLLDVLEGLKAFGAPIKFNNLIFNLLAVIVLGGAALWGLLLYQSGERPEDGEIGGLVVLVVGGVALLIFTRWRDGSARKLANEIFRKDTILDNKLEPVFVEPASAAKELEQQFRDFDRGNYSREIKALYKSEFKGREHDFSYHYYQFHYVDQRTETTTSTDKNGNVRTRTRTVYDHYDRYGIYLPFKLASRIFVIGRQMKGVSGYNYRPASIVFNRLFEIYAADEMAAAKLFKPAVIVAFEEAAEHFRNLNCEINAAGDLCLSFKDDILTSHERSGSLEDIDAYIREIKEHRFLPKLRAALDLIETLMRHSDSNFKETNPWKVQ